MRNNLRQNYRKDNRNFQDVEKEFESKKSKFNEDARQDLFIVNKGYRHYGKKLYLETNEAWSNYDDDKKNTEKEGYGEKADPHLDKSTNTDEHNKNTDQKGYVDDTDFGSTSIKQTPNRNDTDVNNEKN